MPAAPITSATTGNAPRHDAEPAVRRREQDVLAVVRDVRVADLRVALTRADALHDVGADRARLRRVAVGHRLSRAHRARELVVEPRGARGRGWRSVSNAPTSTTTAITTTAASAEPRHPRPPQPQTPPARTICEPRLELGVGDGPETAAHRDAGRARSRTSRVDRSCRSRARRCRSDRTRPAT